MKGYPFLIAIAIIFATLIAAIILSYFVLLPWSERWGATDLEITQALPGDELISGPVTQVTHAVTIQASPEKVWPWLMQLGVDRGGMYSYDALENLIGLKVHTTNEIKPEWQNLIAGDFIRFTPEDYFISPGPGAYIITLQESRVMLACFGMETEQPSPCTNTWQFILQPQADGSTRLIIRTRAVAVSGLGGQTGRLFGLISFTMERKMMLNIRDLVESMP